MPCWPLILEVLEVQELLAEEVVLAVGLEEWVAAGPVMDREELVAVVAPGVLVAVVVVAGLVDSLSLLLPA